ncbi:hypothetical protein CW751_11455 [Brumimicrobium salinarum]|uniref:L,D-TPase catalytic domain-containing protein n=1 Tax=Brumimicrobium salinarum TaxID=2058658 RepID=A0A2I0R0K9_9FLAO|nr:L,D-transpeptidase family protein [Brumimicrobium salinarum]PKR80114.1 hypothetical protein CW751_11455 [Brumimicrobium salinarum]
MRRIFSLFLIPFLVVLLLISCNAANEYNENELNSGKNIDEEPIFIDEKNIHALNLEKKLSNWCVAFYKLRNNQAVWIKKSKPLTDNTKHFFNYVNNDTLLNIPFHYFESNLDLTNSTKEEKEIVTLLRIASFLHLQHNPLFDLKKMNLHPSERVSPHVVLEFINSFAADRSWIEHLITYMAPNANVIRFHFALNHFFAKHPVEQNVNAVKPEDLKDSIAVHKFIVQQLYHRNFISDTLLKHKETIEKLKEFQSYNGLNEDGKLGKNTLSVLMSSNHARYIKGMITLDKLRRLPDSLIQSKFIAINIPSFLLRFYNKGERISTNRVILGTQSNQTPIFSATMKYIVVNPYWNVPYSIASQEILPHLKKDSTYLMRNHYTVLNRDKETVNPDSIDWNKYSVSTFPFFIRQEPGRLNSLGHVKIMFPNQHSIYIHDTPSRYLFNRDARTFSHGCIRTQDPFDLSKHILALEEHAYKDSLPALRKRDKETYLILKDTFPVHVVYHTAGISDSTHQIRFYKDVYNLEAPLYSLFK